MGNAINDLLAIRRCISAMRFSVEEIGNVACAKTAVDFIDKRVEEMKKEGEHGDG